jgi:hypothetical protein
MKICVLTHSRNSGEQEPCAFMLGGRRVQIVGIVDRWGGAARRYLVRDPGGRRFVLRHEEPGGWQLEAVFGPANRARGAVRPAAV